MNYLFDICMGLIAVLVGLGGIALGIGLWVYDAGISANLLTHMGIAVGGVFSFLFGGAMLGFLVENC